MCLEVTYGKGTMPGVDWSKPYYSLSMYNGMETTIQELAYPHYI